MLPFYWIGSIYLLASLCPFSQFSYTIQCSISGEQSIQMPKLRVLSEVNALLVYLIQVLYQIICIFEQ